MCLLPGCALTLNVFAVDDYAVGMFASSLNHTEDASFFTARSNNYDHIFNNMTGFMEARFENGSWAGQDAGWTEGDMWAYTFDVMQDIPGLIKLKGGNTKFVAFLDEHFDGGAYMHLPFIVMGIIHACCRSQ